MKPPVSHGRVVEMNGLIYWVYLALLSLFGFNLATVLPATLLTSMIQESIKKIINIIL